MKHLLKIALIFTFVAAIITACKKETNNTVTVAVKVNMPADFPATATYSGNIVMTSTSTSKEYTAKAVNGTAIFDHVYKDIYDIQVSQTLTATEFHSIAPEIATSESILLNGTLKGLSIAGDGDKADIPQAEINLKWNVASSLLISKIFCNGTKYNNAKTYNMTKYWEIFNNTAGTIYLDGLCIAQAHGNTTSANPCYLYDTYQNEATYAARIAILPGEHNVTKNIPLEGGKSIVIALMAKNFISTEEGTTKMTMAPDLSTADYEINSTATWFTDNENVPNMEVLHDCIPTAGFAQLQNAIFIFFATKQDVMEWETGVDESSYTVASQKKWIAKRVSNSIILDAVETYKEDANHQKRIPDAMDANGIESANNEGAIFDRKILYTTDEGRIVLQDTNNSAKDFTAILSRNRENYDGSHLVPRDYSKNEIQPTK